MFLVSDYESRNIKLPELNPIEIVKLKNGRTGLKIERP